MTQGRTCKNAGDDVAHQKRPAIHPGPRCTTCHRERTNAVRLAKRQERVAKNFNLAPATYDAILAAQGGTCPICRRARGASAMRKGGKRLAVDHNHECCPGPTSCGECVRGLVCARCNDALAHFGDDPEAFERGAEYLRRPPAHAVLLAAD